MSLKLVIVILNIILRSIVTTWLELINKKITPPISYWDVLTPYWDKRHCRTSSYLLKNNSLHNITCHLKQTIPQWDTQGRTIHNSNTNNNFSDNKFITTITRPIQKKETHKHNLYWPSIGHPRSASFQGDDQTNHTPLPVSMIIFDCRRNKSGSRLSSSKTFIPWNY